jgi:hypothetical protein
MTEDKRTTDPERARKPAFDSDGGFSGQDYHLRDEQVSAAAMPAGSVAPRPSRVGGGDPAMPPDNGRRASFDPVTGEVRGSGAGAGGGNPGEDMESDGSGGDGKPITGATPDKGND